MRDYECDICPFQDNCKYWLKNEMDIETLDEMEEKDELYPQECHWEYEDELLEDEHWNHLTDVSLGK